MMKGSRVQLNTMTTSTLRFNPDTTSRREMVDQLTEQFSCTRQEATHIIWECGFRMGTDRSTWIEPSHAVRFLEGRRAIA